MTEKMSILLVEGPNDQKTIDALLEKYSLKRNFTIKPCDGIENLLKQLEAHLKSSAAYGVIGIVVDADKSAESRWQQMRDRLTKTGKYICQKTPLDTKGMIIEANEPNLDAKVGVWIMPDNQYKGTLEDFLLSMVKDDDTLMKEVEKELLVLEDAKLKRYRDIDRNKAKIHTFLSWEQNPGCSLYTAIVSYVLNPKTPTALAFIQWIKALYHL